MVFMEEKGHCHLFGEFGVFVQMMLGGISFAILVLKRILERPKRTWKIWALDSSKQAFSALLAHFLNILSAMFLSLTNSTDACTWYLITVVLDCTIGVLLCVLTLKLVEALARKCGIKNMESGHYFSKGREGSKPKVNYKIWTTQFVVWGLILCFSKLILFGLQMLFAKYLEAAGTWMLGGIEDPDLELVIVMVFIPLVMNMINFWIVDNYIKDKLPHKKLKTEDEHTNFDEPNNQIMEKERNERGEFDKKEEKEREEIHENELINPEEIKIGLGNEFEDNPFD